MTSLGTSCRALLLCTQCRVSFGRITAIWSSLIVLQLVYTNIGTLHLEWASTILGVIAIFVTAPLYYFYAK